MNKSEYACRQTVEGLGPDLRMWTFTLAHCIEPKIAAKLWSRVAQDRLKRRLGFSGLRVFELHPGGHGLHVHFVTANYYRVQDVRDALKGTEWGRVHVERINKNAAGYVAKYITKAKRSGAFKGVRLWATLGIPRANATRVKDIACVSARSELYHELAAKTDDPLTTAKARFSVMNRAQEIYPMLSPERVDLLRARSLLRVVDSMLIALNEVPHAKRAGVIRAALAMQAEAAALGVNPVTDIDRLPWSLSGESAA